MRHPGAPDGRQFNSTAWKENFDWTKAQYGPKPNTGLRPRPVWFGTMTTVKDALAARPGVWCLNCLVNHTGLRNTVVMEQLDGIPLVINIGVCAWCKGSGPSVAPQ
jgi:hypothetical protein